jgi:hypothetical protein
MAVILSLGQRALRFRALFTAPGCALGDAGHFGPRASARGAFMPHQSPVFCCYFGARTSGDNLIGQSALEIFVMKFRKELLKNGLKFTFFFSEGWHE